MSRCCPKCGYRQMEIGEAVDVHQRVAERLAE